MTEKEHICKIVVVGDIGTGKTSFVKRLVHNMFSIHYKPTIGVDHALKVLKNGDDTFRHQMWELSGHERFGNMTCVYYQETAGAFVIIDSTRDLTLAGAKKWKSDLDAKINWADKYSPEYNPVILLVNKIDLLDDDIRSKLNYNDFCKENGFHSWFAISAAKEGEDNCIEKACLAMTEICKNAKEFLSPSVKDEKSNKAIKQVEPVELIRTSEEILCGFMEGIFTIVNEDEDRMNNSDKVKELRVIAFSTYFNPKMEFLRKEFESNEQLRNTAANIHDVLVNKSTDDSNKISDVLNLILDYGKNRTTSKEHNDVEISKENNDGETQTPEENLCNFMEDIFTIVNKNEVLMANIYKIRKLRNMVFSIYFNSTLKLKSNEQLRNAVEGVHNILVDKSIGDPDKIIDILNFILDFGKNTLTPRFKKNDNISASEPLLDNAIERALASESSLSRNLGSSLANALLCKDMETRKSILIECLEKCKKNPDELNSFRQTIEDCLIDAKLNRFGNLFYYN